MFEEIASILADQLGINQSKITMDSDIIKDLGADSLDVVELMMTLEDNTGKSIPDDKVADLKTVGDVVRLVESL
ncbi:MAG: acyl carrier protein [Clostridia bacterium]|nr:acyl carrier protein [Clostridia bacterium]